ncbi:NADP-dependent phosphogluconate dehydrogenase [Melissococcus plutonius]|uniref:6-phosphogluconate dehydrogenase, decarboxylating n=1 Tax=Melissococcus plutonius (strain ATCC 35311 / DSM 29964 / CIP 104052 / LMG 20360 / NCIMB 702443) TaxID=940190 RepID=F3YB89_MELPT|nr:NADP-dependent phosphogluconate dehydrogenase [Melissococcus plutonius]KMT31035.1 6-phosphogluconate dehydrogenase, decarboxylating [Melissococcus plutonius]KMT33734.1 6-phosphogluconate dehydrogenase, decarboxylating [Melissococcus plutonius]KMT38904.1 6-phosphogluconate dehydrogenase, decarboxylating [Melissococcus plutonius]MBB5177636.1 6-phosphogluconate dehydrogenase [Melissococcus plutonius]BAK21767.1 6-phosphogluconate dehydrogenase, decarboxylating [Melissococcus plutonius ATCC 3531
MTKQQFGVIGMAVMGKNLALNIESRGYSVALYNRTSAKTTRVVEEHPGKNFKATYTIQEFTETIERPRRILLMVQAGKATDETIQALLPYLDKGDILIDGGNTFFKDTMRRNEELANSGINFIGTGISGGEKGALKGPSIMPGGQKDAYELVAPILEKIAAKAEDGQPCVTYIGPNGAGHYVKMVHNGIEYGDMQLIAEAYDLMKHLLGLTVDEMAEIFSKWNEGELNSYLIEITADILTRKDDLGSGAPIVDEILDAAGNKGTGKWTSQSALDLGVPLSLITESVFARFISAYKEERVKASKLLLNTSQFTYQGNKEELIEKIRQALYFCKIMSYAQGFSQLKAASDEYNWQLPFGDIAKIWRAGCIIRAQFLQKITGAYDKNPKIDNLLLDDYFLSITQKYQAALRDVVSIAVQAGIPTPTFSSAIAYYDSYRSERLPANLIQAQRDYFGAHTYERIDREGIYHYSWYHEE